MSYTPCNVCGEPLLGYEGSACTNLECVNAPRSDDPNPRAKSPDGAPYSIDRARRDDLVAGIRHTRATGKAAAMRRTFKGIR